MKLTISPDGTITVDTPDSPSAAAFVRELYGGQVRASNNQPAKAAKAIEAKPGKKLAHPRKDRPISKREDETWTWLGVADRPEGLTAAELAQALHITESAASQRLTKLVKRDMAWRPSTGHYRVGSIEASQSAEGPVGQPRGGV